jgi:heat shock protein HslJ
MRTPTLCFTLRATALAALVFSTQGIAADRKPVLEYVKPGTEVVFVSKLEPPVQDVDGWSFVIERWSDFTTDEIQAVEAAGQRVALVFSDGSLSGQGPCNSLTGSYELTDGVMRFGPVGRSKKMCANADVMAMEDKLVEFLSKVDSMERIGPTLVLRSSDEGKMSLWGSQTPSTETDDSK